jgi:alkanesulfonate monooxygenase SsuD/methylene tetrahydromethanopterin reductase-like flavin-dependent oxidoreductase (luciferase family)
MPNLWLNFDMRQPDFAKASRAALYATAIDIAAWADQRGWQGVHFAEHHAAEDGYVTSPLLMCAAAAARTRRLELFPIVLVPFYDPIRLAEDIAVLDQLSGGRLRLLFAAGYRPVEFDGYGLRMGDRRALVDQAVEVCKQAWSGEPFKFRGRTVVVRPTPLQQPRPPIYLGATTKRQARHAAHIVDSYIGRKVYYNEFRDECLKIGRPDPGPYRRIHPHFLYVTEDPEKSLHEIGANIMHSLNSYNVWFREAWNRPWTTPDGRDMPMVETLDELRAEVSDPAGGHRICTPEECIAMANELEDSDDLAFRPLLGGIEPDLAWASLELFDAKVKPKLRAGSPGRTSVAAGAAAHA